MKTTHPVSQAMGRPGRKKSGRPVLLVAFICSFLASAGISGEGPAGAGGVSDTSLANPGFTIKELDVAGESALVVCPLPEGEKLILKHQKVGPWALMAVIEEGGGRMAVFEDIEDRTGAIVFMTRDGVVLSLPKSLERTSVPPESLYGGKRRDEIMESRKDIMGEEILAGRGDPSYEKVAAFLPPLRVPTFVGTRYSIDKPTFDYGAFSDEIYVDVGKVFPEIAAARKKKDVWEGLVGGWLPVPRFLFPAGEKRYWDVVIFAEEDPSKFWTQPLWFRILLIEDGRVKEAHHFYHHLPYPPRGEPAARDFYRALFKVHGEWRKALDPPMKIEVPEKRIGDFCRHALAMEMITRVGSHPKYGYPPLGGIDVFGGYGYSNVDTFQDVFNTSVITFLEWGLFDIAGGYIDDYFDESVREDGSIDTRGPEIGQYGLMLTALARYYDYTKDEKRILKHLTKIRGIVKLFVSLREESLKLPPGDPAYGIISGWSEHDSCLKEAPYALILPHFSNSAHACRGFQDLGRVFKEIGRKIPDVRLEEEGNKMVAEAGAIKRDLYEGIRKSTRLDQDPPYLPPVAGDKPTFFQGRVYTEMLHSGVLTGDMVKTIVRYQAESGEKILGLTGNMEHITGFLFYGYAYGILQQDWVRDYLLSYYAHMAHLHSRGTWTGVESANTDGSKGAPYCSTTQLTIPSLTKWMLVFEDPNEPVLWLAKATPAAWLEDGLKISVKGAPTRYGEIAYELRSEIGRGRVRGTIGLPQDGIDAVTKIRIRVPVGRKMRKVTVNGRTWKGFDPLQDIVVLPAGLKGPVALEVTY